MEIELLNGNHTNIVFIFLVGMHIRFLFTIEFDTPHEAIHFLCSELFVPTRKLQLWRYSSRKALHMVIVFVANQLVAVLLEKRVNKRDGVYEIVAIAVKVVYRRQGVGKMLMQTYLSNRHEWNVQLHISFATTFMNIIGFPSSHVSITNEEAIRLYQSLGFSITTTIPTYYNYFDSPEAYRMIYNKPMG